MEMGHTCGYQPSLSAIGFVTIMSDIQSVYDHELFRLDVRSSRSNRRRHRNSGCYDIAGPYLGF
jgi:hypothetical protein